MVVTYRHCRVGPDTYTYAHSVYRNSVTNPTVSFALLFQRLLEFLHTNLTRAHTHITDRHDRYNDFTSSSSSSSQLSSSPSSSSSHRHLYRCKNVYVFNVLISQRFSKIKNGRPENIMRSPPVVDGGIKYYVSKY